LTRILADENIPLPKGTGHEGQISTRPGREISRADLGNIDILFVRSVTKVNETLLKNTPVRFVGTATAGHDHLDIAWLQQAGIQWAAAPGCNAQAVTEYLVCTIAALQKKQILTGAHPKAAVIGAGWIGQPVAEILALLGFEVFVCDPFRKDLPTVPFQDIAGMDLVTLHVPLTKTDHHPTFHMIDTAFLQRQNPGCLIMNTSRGGVIATATQRQHAESYIWCLDVFENEPRPDPDILQTALITTPHIAGYSIQAKERGALQICEAAANLGILPASFKISAKKAHIRLSFGEEQPLTWQEVVLRIFNPEETSQTMKEAIAENPGCFDRLRKNFRERHEFSSVEITGGVISNHEQDVLKHLGIRLPALSV